MRQTSRRGMELAINTLVVLILGVVIVAGGIALMYSIYNKASVMPDRITKEQESELFQILLDSKQRIVVLNNVQTVTRGGNAYFPVAIENQVEAPQATFIPKNPVNTAAAPTTECITDAAHHLDTCPSLTLLAITFTMNRYDMHSFPVVVTVPNKAAAGQYVFNVDVMNMTATGNLYARAKVTVNVE